MSLFLGFLLIYGPSDFIRGWEFVPASRGLVSWRVGLGLVAAPDGLRIKGQDTDLDDDGWPDIVFCEGEWMPVRWVVAALGPQMKTYHVPFLRDPVFTDGCALADLDYDGEEDLVFCVMQKPGHEYWGPYIIYELWGWRRVDTLPFSHKWGQESVFVADLDSDGWQDLVFAVFGHLDTLKVDNYIFWGSPWGFTEFTRLPGSSGAHGVAVGDLNGDGLLDVVIGNSYAEMPRYTVVYFNPGRRGEVWDDTLLLNSHGVFGLTVADLNADGWLDILAANTWDGAPVEVYFNRGGTFSRDPDLSLRPFSWGARAIWVEDFDKDGWLDIAVVQKTKRCGADDPTYSDSLAVIWSDSLKFERVTKLLNIGGFGLFCEDFDRNGWLDIAVFNKEGTGPCEHAMDTVSFIYFNQGPPKFFEEEHRLEFRSFAAGRGRSHDFVGNPYNRERVHWLLLPSKTLETDFWVRVDSVKFEGNLAGARITPFVADKNKIVELSEGPFPPAFSLALRVEFDPRRSSEFVLRKVKVYYSPSAKPNEVGDWEVALYDVSGRKLSKPCKRNVVFYVVKKKNQIVSVRRLLISTPWDLLQAGRFLRQD